MVGTLASMCSMLEGAAARADDLSLADTVQFCLTVQDLRPLGAWSSTVETVMRSAALERMGLPLLAYVPLSALALSWEMGELPASAQVHSWDYKQPDLGEGPDYGTHISQCLRMMGDDLSALMAEVARADDRAFAAGQAIGSNLALNHRQRAALGVLLEGAGELTVRAHMESCHVAYATARADLLGLAEMGLAVARTQGRAMVFGPGRALEELARKGWAGL